MKKYKKRAIFESLKGHCHFAKENDFIEVTEWKNGEGFDVYVDSSNKIDFKLTYGEFDLLKKIIKELDK